MPKKEYKQTGEYKLKNLGKIPWNKGLKGVMPIPWNKNKKGLQVAWNKGMHIGVGNKNPFYGKHHSEESKLKMSIKKLGRVLSEEQKRKISLSSIGKIKSEEHRKNLSLANLGKPGMKGENHPNWKGGKSLEGYPIEFDAKLRGEIRKKYGYRCQECFKYQDELFTKNRGGRIVKEKLAVHHIDYNKNNNNINNLIALCRRCHIKTNYDREDWTNYFKDKVIYFE